MIESKSRRLFNRNELELVHSFITQPADQESICGEVKSIGPKLIAYCLKTDISCFNAPSSLQSDCEKN